MAKLAVRWITSEQCRRYIEYDQIRPSWTHFLPQLERTRVGICFDMLTNSNWRGFSKRIGFVINSDELPKGVQSFEIVGERIHDLTDQLRWVFDKAEFRKLVQEAKSRLGFYTDSPNELFVLGTIDSLGQRLKGVVQLDTGKPLGPRCQAELSAFAAANNIPLLNVTPDEFSAIRYEQNGLAKRLEIDPIASGESSRPIDRPRG